MAWLSDWAYRRKIVIDQTKVDADLTNFPVMLRLDASAGIGASDVTHVFTVLGANSLKLAVTTSDGTTQCYVEVALWDNGNSLATLFVKVPSVAGATDTELYIYYDSSKADNSTYVGVVGSTPGQAVWDSNFLAVYHLTETPSGANSIKDSTAAASHASPSATPALTDGAVDKALDFERGDLDYVTYPVAASVKNKAAGTMEAFFNLESFNPTSQNAGLVFEGTNTSGYTRLGIFTQYIGASDTRLLAVGRDSDTGSAFTASDTVTLALSTWYHAAVSYDSATESMKVLKNGAQAGENTTSKGAFTNTTPYALTIGAAPGPTTYYHDGLIDEARISGVARSNAWIKATYNTLADTLVTYGAIEEIVALGYGAAVFEAFGITVDLSSVNVPLGFAALVFEAYGIGITILPGAIGDPVWSAKKPIFTCSGKTPSQAVSGKRPSAVWTAEV